MGVVATRTLGWWWADPWAALDTGAAAGVVAVSLVRGAGADEPTAMPDGS